MEQEDVYFIEQVEKLFEKYRTSKIATDLKIALLDVSKSALLVKIILLKQQIND